MWTIELKWGPCDGKVMRIPRREQEIRIPILTEERGFLHAPPLDFDPFSSGRLEIARYVYHQHAEDRDCVYYRWEGYA